MKPLAVIVGSGQGLGSAVAAKLASAGYQVVGLNRSVIKHVDARVQNYQLDAADARQVTAAMTDITTHYGTPRVLVHNPAQLLIKPLMVTSVDDFELAWRSMVLSAINMLHVVLPMMSQSGEGTVIASGATASIRGGARFAAFASAKFALRGLMQSVAREYQSQGVHVVHVILDGILDTPASRKLHSLDPDCMMSTDEVAEAYLQIIQQSPSAWTHELDLRPYSETF